MNAGRVGRWQRLLADRLATDGHEVGISYSRVDVRSRLADLLVDLEPQRFGTGLARKADPPAGATVEDPELFIDLTGDAPVRPKTMTIGLAGERGLDGLPALLVRGGQPNLVVRLGGKAIGEAFPMVRDRLWLGRAMEDVLARAISLIAKCVRDIGAGRAGSIEVADEPPQRGGFVPRYLAQLTAGVAGRALARRTHHGFYWRTGFRPAPAHGVAETASLEGGPWTLLPDDGRRFYADPFVFEHQGRTFLFVEDYPYDIGRGLVSVAELGPDGGFTRPRVVLDEPWHLSYPQVFARGGEVWMIPETSAEKKLLLYRAEAFPDRWVREAVLVEGPEVSDATLLEHGGRLWLVAAGRDGYGSASDMMMVYSAPELTGPWTPHPRNPVLIDRRRARPGGAFVTIGERLYLPVQDGSERYGGGLGFAELLELGDNDVRFSMPRPVAGSPTWSAIGLHTYNRAGGLEVVDGFAELRR